MKMVTRNEKETDLLLPPKYKEKVLSNSSFIFGVRNLTSWIVFISLSLIWFPFQIILALWVAYKQIWISKRLGISQTAIEIFNGRWTMDAFEIKVDPIVRKLGYVLENSSVRALWWCLLPFWVKYKISGEYSMYPVIPSPGDEKFKDLVPARTLYFDQIIDRVLPQVDQFVLLGAGYDCRAYQYCHLGIKIFEIDQDVVQKHKLKMLRQAKIDYSKVNFLTVDFSKEKMIDVLKRNGFETHKKSLFLMEGVTLYLHENDVRNTMKQFRENTAPGSVFLADFYGTSFIKLQSSSANKTVLEATGELMNFGMNFEENWQETMEDFIQSEGLCPGHLSFMGSNHDDGPWCAIAESVNKSINY